MKYREKEKKLIEKRDKVYRSSTGTQSKKKKARLTIGGQRRAADSI